MQNERLVALVGRMENHMRKTAAVCLGLVITALGCDGTNNSAVLPGGGGTGTATGAGGGTATNPGTGLALGTFCVKFSVDAERCETTNNRVQRLLASGNIELTLQHGTSFSCMDTEINNFEVVAVVPDGVTLPYKNVTDAGANVGRASTSCSFVDYVLVPSSSVIYRTGTGGSSNVEGEIAFSAVVANYYCGNGSVDYAKCPETADIRFRFNLAL